MTVTINNPAIAIVEVPSAETVVVRERSVEIINEGLESHGELSGLEADDHPQYFNSSRLATYLTAALAVVAFTGSYGDLTNKLVAGTNISIDNSDPDNPVISSLSDRYKTTSTTSHAIVSNGTLTFTVSANLAYTALQEVIIAYDLSNHMHGTVVSYSGTTLVVDIKQKSGSGTYSLWTINLDGTPIDALSGSGIVNELAYFTSGTVLGSLPVATYPNLTEISYVKGVTSGIQSQLDGKQALLPNFTANRILYGDGDNIASSSANFTFNPSTNKLELKAAAAQSTAVFNFQNTSGASRVALQLGVVGTSTEHGIVLLTGATSSYVGDFTNPAIQFNNSSNGIYVDSNRVFFKAGGSFAGGLASVGFQGNAVQINTTASGDNLTEIKICPYRLNATSLKSGLAGNAAGDVALTTNNIARLTVTVAGNTVASGSVSALFSSGFLLDSGVMSLLRSTTGNSAGSSAILFTGATNIDKTFSFKPAGTLTQTSGTIGFIETFGTFGAGAGSANFRPASIIYTINNTGAQSGNATGLFLNATETALNSMTHNLMDLQVAGSSKFKVDNIGQITAASNVNGSAFVASNANNGYIVTNIGRLRGGGSDGVWRLTNIAETGFGRLCLGGITATDVAIKKNGTGIDIRTGDDSAYAVFNALTIRARQAAGFISSDGSAGATGTATAVNTLTIKDGLITNIA